jgi:hypothetical protein
MKLPQEQKLSWLIKSSKQLSLHLQRLKKMVTRPLILMLMF